MVDEDASHCLGGHGEEVLAVLPVGPVLVDQPQPRLMHQAGGLQGVAGGLVPESGPGHPRELVVDQRHQLVERVPATGGCLAQQAGDLVGRVG